MNSTYQLIANEINQDFIEAIKKLYGQKKIIIQIKDEDEEWMDFSSSQLANAYSVNEPDYDYSMLNEPNADYKK